LYALILITAINNYKYALSTGRWALRKKHNITLNRLSGEKDLFMIRKNSLGLKW
jgi:hypothetical protein